jgi:hypothetical protein
VDATADPPAVTLTRRLDAGPEAVFDTFADPAETPAWLFRNGTGTPAHAEATPGRAAPCGSTSAAARPSPAITAASSRSTGRTGWPSNAPPIRTIRPRA